MKSKEMWARRPWVGRPVGAAVISGVAVMASLVAVFALLSNRTQQPVQPGRAGFSFDSSPVRIDRPAPPFALPFLGVGGVGGLTRYRGRVVVLNFWAAWCTACRAEAPRLESLREQYRSRGVSFLGADEKDSRDAALAFVDRFGVTYPSVFDASGSLAARYGVVGLPTTFIIDRSGRLRYQVVGRVSPKSFARALETVLGNA